MAALWIKKRHRKVQRCPPRGMPVYISKPVLRVGSAGLEVIPLHGGPTILLRVTTTRALSGLSGPDRRARGEGGGSDLVGPPSFVDVDAF
jgi:hypothetical protein